MPELLFFPTSSNRGLSDEVLHYVKRIPTLNRSRIGELDTGFHADREPAVELLTYAGAGEGCRCIVLACIVTDEIGSVNDHAMEALSLLDALWRDNADVAAIVFPYLPYARSDRRKGKKTDRTSVTAKMFADFIGRTRPHRVCIVEPHNTFLEGFFECPVDSIPALHLFVKPVREVYTDPERIIVVSPDRGGWDRASVLSRLLGISRPIAWVDKRRASGEADAFQLSAPVNDLDVVVVDDMTDTFRTQSLALKLIQDSGARRIIVCVVHGLFNGDAVKMLEQSPIERVIVTSSVAQKPSVLACSKIKVLPLGPLIAEAIHRLVAGVSLKDLGKPE